MGNEIASELPTVTLATEPWVNEQLMDTDRRFEKAFHEQTRYLSQQREAANEKLEKQWALTNEKLDRQWALANEKLDTTLRWIIGLFVTMTIAIILAVLFK